MNKKFNPEAADTETPEWSQADFKKAKQLAQMPAEFQQTIRRARGPQKLPTKIQTTIRFDQDVLEGLKATGRGWQTRVNDTMREWLNQR